MKNLLKRAAARTQSKEPLPSLLFIPLANAISWPCQVRVSARAKKMKIVLNSQGMIEVVVPQSGSYSAKDVQSFLQSAHDWLQKNIEKLGSVAVQAERAEQILHQLSGTVQASILPQSIIIPYFPHEWRIRLKPRHQAHVELHEIPNEQDDGGELLLFANEDEMRICCLLLQKWLSKSYASLLKEKTFALSTRMGLEVGQVRIKAQRSRWGSCSARGNINLNCRLLLLEADLLEHVILHELCHLVHMNHSQEFKKLLSSVSTQSARKEKALDTAWSSLPAWALMS